MATDMRPDLGPFGEEPKGGENKKVPGSVLTSFRLDSGPKGGAGGERKERKGGRQGRRNVNVFQNQNVSFSRAAHC